MVRAVHIAADPTFGTILRSWLEQYIHNIIKNQALHSTKQYVPDSSKHQYNTGQQASLLTKLKNSTISVQP